MPSCLRQFTLTLDAAGARALARCEPIRAFARRAERSIEDAASFEGQCLPFSNANFESGGLAVAQLSHGSVKHCPDAISHSTGNNETKATFTRSISALTTHRSHRSFRIQSDCSCTSQLFHGNRKPCYYKSASHLYSDSHFYSHSHSYSSSSSSSVWLIALPAR